jgi:hypothetical protein
MEYNFTIILQNGGLHVHCPHVAGATSPEFNNFEM